MYNKFSCYKTGELERTPKALKDLSYTYFTVEKLNPSIKRQKIVNDDEISTEEDFYKEYKEQFKDINKEIENILNGIKYSFEWEINNGSLFSHFKIDEFLDNKKFETIKGLNNDSFFISVENSIKSVSIKVYKKI